MKWPKWLGGRERRGSERGPSRADLINDLVQLANTEEESIDFVKTDCKVLLSLLGDNHIYSNARIAEDPDRLAAANDLRALKDLRGDLSLSLFLALEARARDRKERMPTNHIEDTAARERFALMLVKARRTLERAAGTLVPGFVEALAQTSDIEKNAPILILRVMPDLAKKLPKEDRLNAMRGLWFLAKITHGVQEIGAREEFGEHFDEFEKELQKVIQETWDIVNNKMQRYFPPSREEK